MSGDPERTIATELRRRGLAAPVRLLLDAHRPLAPLLADAGAALDPLLRVFGGRMADDVRHLLENEAGLDRVIAALDDEGEPHAKPG